MKGLFLMDGEGDVVPVEKVIPDKWYTVVGAPESNFYEGTIDDVFISGKDLLGKEIERRRG